MDLNLFFSTFALIFVAELPDKTAMSTLLMATRAHPGALFIGAALAFLIQSLVAVAFGSVLALLPAHWIQLGTGLLFLGFAAAMWFRKEDVEKEDESLHATSPDTRFWRTVWSSFGVVFIAELGDLTQLSTASLAAKYREPLTVFLGSLLALWSVTLIAIAVGHRLKAFIRPEPLKKVAAVAFSAVGVYFLVSWFRGV